MRDPAGSAPASRRSSSGSRLSSTRTSGEAWQTTTACGLHSASVNTWSLEDVERRHYAPIVSKIGAPLYRYRSPFERGEAARISGGECPHRRKNRAVAAAHGHEEFESDAAHILATLSRPGAPRMGDRFLPEEDPPRLRSQQKGLQTRRGAPPEGALGAHRRPRIRRSRTSHRAPTRGVSPAHAVSRTRDVSTAVEAVVLASLRWRYHRHAFGA